MEHRVDSINDGERVEVVLSRLADISRTKAQRYIKEGCVFVNDKKVEKSSNTVSTGDVLHFNLPDTEKLWDLEPENIPLDIVYEDDDLMIINKPAGMVVHPGAGVTHGTLANAIAFHLKDAVKKLHTIRPGIVHRIDKDTSGLLIVAKKPKVQEALSTMMSDRKVQKQYITLVSGKGIPKKGSIESPIIRNPHVRTKMMISAHPHARHAVTHFDRLAEYKSFSLLECTLITGRTHQIRVHMQAVGHPIVGDTTYGDKKINKEFKDKYYLKRQFLHAYKLTFIHPITQKEINVKIPLPEDLQHVLNALKIDIKI